MSNIPSKSEVAIRTNALGRNIFHRATNVAQLGKRAFEGIKESVVNFGQRRKLEIMLSAGTLAMSTSIGAMLAVGVEAARAGAETAADIAYANTVPRHLLVNEGENDAANLDNPIRVSAESSMASATDTTTVKGIGGVLLFGIGASAGTYALRGLSRRETSETSSMSDPVPVVLIDGAFQNTYRPTPSERFDNTCGEMAVGVIEAVHARITKSTNYVRTWLTGLQTSREAQLAISAQSYSPFDTYTATIEPLQWSD